MPFNGNGVYSAPSSPGEFNPAVAGQQAQPTTWNTLLTDMAAGLSNLICRDGQTTITADLPMATHKLTGVGNAAARDQYAAAGQVQDGVFTYADDTGAADAYVITLAPAIAAYVKGQIFTFKIAHANATTTPTLAVNGLTAGTITLPNGGGIAVGTMPANGVVIVAVSAVSTGTPTFQLQTLVATVSVAGNNNFTGINNFSNAANVFVGDGSGLTGTVPPGVVSAFAGSSAPTGYALCDGSSQLRIGTFAALFAVIETTYGSADGTHFNLPDLRGRAVFGVDGGAGRLGSGPTGGITGSATLGASGGAQSHSMTAAENGPHTHSAAAVGSLVVSDASATQPVPVAGNTGSSGSGTAHNILNPALVLNYIIKT